jgi:uncharacterized protein
MLIDLPIEVDLERIATFCRERGIARLSLFGSVLRKDFNPERSDIDVLVEFRPDVHPGLKFFGYGDELTEIIGHKVDLNTPQWLSKHFREDVLREALPLYEQA